MFACTSYPAENRFVEAVDTEEVLRVLQQRGGGAAVGGHGPLSLHVQIPFCASPASQCACRQVVTRRHARAVDYLQALEHEIARAAGALGSRQSVCRVHIGGATPLFLSDIDLARLVGVLREAFRVSADAELSLEVDPRVCGEQRLAGLRALGFNRIVVALRGDGDAAAASVQLPRSLDALMAATRALGFDSVTMDVLLGRPGQTPALAAQCLRRITALRPDCVVLERYRDRHGRPRTPVAAHAVAALPANATDLIAMQRDAIEHLQDCGYVHIGLDEFARAGSPLAVAQRQGRLYRGLVGFSTRPEGDVLALGVSAVGHIGASHYRNVDGLSDYYDALRRGELPVARGLVLGRDELARRAVIMGLLCQGRVDFEAISLSHLIDMRRYFAPEFLLIEPMARAGLVTIDAEAIELTATGAWFARGVAAVFDRELQRAAQRERCAFIE